MDFFLIQMKEFVLGHSIVVGASLYKNRNRCNGHQALITQMMLYRYSRRNRLNVSIKIKGAGKKIAITHRISTGRDNRL